MTKKLIAVDVDDVLLPHFQDLASWYNKTYGTHLTLADNYSKDLRVWGTATDEEAIRRVQGFFDSNEFRNMLPFQEAKEALLHLSTRYELIVITARDTILEEVTRAWLNTHFASLFREVHFTARFSLEGKRRSKADVLMESGAAYLIDDSLDHIQAAHSVGVGCVIFGDYPWNQSKSLPDDIVRCNDWRAVEAYFEGQQA